MNLKIHHAEGKKLKQKGTYCRFCLGKILENLSYILMKKSTLVWGHGRDGRKNYKSEKGNLWDWKICLVI